MFLLLLNLLAWGLVLYLIVIFGGAALGAAIGNTLVALRRLRDQIRSSQRKAYQAPTTTSTMAATKASRSTRRS